MSREMHIKRLEDGCIDYNYYRTSAYRHRIAERDHFLKTAFTRILNGMFVKGETNCPPRREGKDIPSRSLA